MALSDEEVASWRDKLDREKEKVPGRLKFPSDVCRELDALEKELAGYGYDPEFSADILRQIAESLVRCDGSDRLRLRCARSIIKEVKSGDQMQMLLVVQMIGVHVATMNLVRLMNASKDLDHCDSYGNLCNKFARTFVGQLETLQRLRSGPEQKLTVHNVSVNDGGQAIVGHVTQNAIGKGQPGCSSSPGLVTDQSGMAMPIVEPKDQLATVAPAIEKGQESAPRATKRQRRA